MPGIDPTIALGAKAPDPMQNLSGLLNAANGAQAFRQNQQKTQQGSIDLQERQGVQGVLADPSNYTDQDGNIDFNRALPAVMRVAPTTGMRYVQDLMTAQKQQVDAKQSLNNLTTDVRTQAGKVLYGIPSDAPPEVVNGTIDALSKQYKGGETYFNTLKNGYAHASQQGKGPDFIANAAKTTMPPQTQQTMATPDGPQVDNGQQVVGVNTKPGVPGYPQGSQVFSVQKQLPPTTPTVAPGTNQPGYIGPQPGAAQAPQPQAQPGVRGSFTGNPSDVQMAIGQIRDPQQRANAQAAFEAQMRATNGQLPAPGFVPSGPVPGANESKGGTVQTMNQHWDNLNKQSENSQLLEGLLGNIKSLAPGAITGTESGRKAYVNGLLNSLHLGNQATGDIQKDTDLLEKNIAQLGLNTPAATDAMRTIIGAARPHGTMSQGAIEEASAQLMGQIQANRAVRNALAGPKKIADQSGDPSTYQSVRQHIEEVADPRAWQFQALSPEGRKAMLSKLTPEDRAALRSKIADLHDMGLLK